jgi:hypothetical protein
MLAVNDAKRIAHIGVGAFQAQVSKFAAVCFEAVDLGAFAIGPVGSGQRG